MPLDHYVSQVHLRHFYSPALNELMFAVRKSDRKTFCCNSKSVCRIEDGSSNAYLRRDRLIEEFLQFVLTELLEDGTVSFKIDPKFPQALGITSIIGWVSVFGNSRSEILRNEEADTPFFTSDFPVGLERGTDPRGLNRIVPLAPDLAIRICPHIRLSGQPPDLSFKTFKAKQHRLKRREVVEANRCIVRCAEDTVFYRDDFDWVVPFISKHRRYRVEGVTQRIPHGRGFLNVSTQRIISTQST